MTKVATFGCPSDGLQTDEFPNTTWGRIRTNYAVNFGNTDYGQDSNQVDPVTGAAVRFGGAPFSMGKVSTIATILDGTSNTLMWGEVITPPDSAGWDGPIAETMVSVGGQGFEAWTTPNSKTPDLVTRSARPSPAPASSATRPSCRRGRRASRISPRGACTRAGSTPGCATARSGS